MIKRIAIAIAVAVVALVAFIATRPNEFQISRSTIFAAPPAKIFPLVNNLHAFQTWNPYAKKDPSMEQVWEGPPAGVGAVYRWSGNNDIGAGSMTITESRPNDLVKLDLAFLRPFEATNEVAFTFEPQGEKTLVTWAMHGKNNFVAKAMQLVMDMDKMVGTDFEKGLADMRAIAEAS